MLSKKHKKLQNEEIDNQLISFISYFMTIQYIRAEKFIDNVQASWDEVGKCYNEFSGDNRYPNLFDNFVKKQIPIVDLGYIPHPHAHIIYNKTNLPFITSDNPVIRRNVNKVDLQIVMPKEYIADNVSESHECVLFFFPLTPSIAYVSCELLICDQRLYFDDHQLGNIFYINYWSIINSHKRVYSSIIEPIKGEEKLSYILQQKEQTTYIKIYTVDHRIMTKGKFQHTNNNSILFVCENKQELLKLDIGMKISLVEVIKNNFSIRGMRDCFVKNLDIMSGSVEIESHFKLDI